MNDKLNDPTPELYALMDESKLNINSFSNGKTSMSVIITRIRSSLAMKLKSYIKRRDSAMYQAGYKQATADMEKKYGNVQNT